MVCPAKTTRKIFKIARTLKLHKKRKRKRKRKVNDWQERYSKTKPSTKKQENKEPKREEGNLKSGGRPVFSKNSNDPFEQVHEQT
jgi:predicted RNase H-like nuclease